MRSLRRSSFLWLALLTIVVTPARATVPSTTSYQGVLTDNSGNLVVDGPYNLVFRMYDVASGGSALWTETQSGVPVSKGGFAVILGSLTPLNLPFDKQYYLGVTVNAGPELTPRVIVAGSPQALSLRLPFVATQSSSASLLSITNTGGGPAIVGTPSIMAGNPTTIGSIGVTGPGASGMTGWLFETSVGAELRLYSPGGIPFAGIMPWGPSYTWGRMYISGAGGFAGMAVEANNSITEDPNLLLLGQTNSMYLDMSQIGVQCPAARERHLGVRDRRRVWDRSGTRQWQRRHSCQRILWTCRGPRERPDHDTERRIRRGRSRWDARYRGQWNKPESGPFHDQGHARWRRRQQPLVRLGFHVQHSELIGAPRDLDEAHLLRRRRGHVHLLLPGHRRQPAPVVQLHLGSHDHSDVPPDLLWLRHFGDLRSRGRPRWSRRKDGQRLDRTRRRAVRRRCGDRRHA